MADALLSAPVAVTTGVVAVSLIAIAVKNINKEKHNDNVALMGVLGAFVFVAQMINFTIPGTGSSGHIIGGILLAAMLGRWRGFITICSVLMVQCLVFADGGLLALGCNIVNMGAMSCLVAYPLVYRAIVHKNPTPGRIMWASVLSCIVALELGAVLVTVETTASGITALPMGEFLMFMLPIHFVIGLCEGVATGLVLSYVARHNPAQLDGAETAVESRRATRRLVVVFLAVAIVLGAVFFFIASGNPDGLEWSIMKVTGFTELAPSSAPSTAFMAGYESHFSGIVGGVIVMSLLWAVTSLVFHRRRNAATR